VAFRRLDQEIANGYNLTERKEKELKIAELLAKNQKVRVLHMQVGASRPL
jgi:hypothetical protein